MDVSIIIVSYNEKDYLAEAIESCLKQDIFVKGGDAEILIGDDGSNDGSVEIIQQYCANYPDIIKCFEMERTIEGPIIPSIRCSAVIKRGLELARGEYVQLLSADDKLVDLSKISSAIYFLNRNSIYSACYTDFYFYWDDGTVKYIKNKKADFSRAVFWAMEYRHISCFVFRRIVRERLLDYFCDDTGLYLSCFISGKIKHLPGYSFAYRQRATGIMSTSDPVELDLLELLLYQDVCNKGFFQRSSLAKFSVPMLRSWKHREIMTDDKYFKYFAFAHGREHDFLLCLKDWKQLTFWNKSFFFMKLFRMYIYRTAFKLLDIVETFFF